MADHNADAGPAPSELAPPLLAWFDASRRDLPWRRTNDPYRIWVAEVMLHQTQVDRVIGYYERFVQAFPSVEALAAAPLDAVLQLWAGLGYYSRARNLHAAAAIIVKVHGGLFPTALSEVLALPGIGRYSAGAILSIAFGQPLPALDANAVRVLARVFGIKGDTAKGAGRQRLKALGAAAVPQERPGDYNQALMELGALVCSPRRPDCMTCCLGDLCVARATGRQAEIPPARRSVSRAGRAVAAVVRRGEAVLIAQRPPSGVWGGLWEFPWVELDSGADPAEALQELLLQAFGLPASVGKPMARLRYGIMNQRMELVAYACEALADEIAAREHIRARWVMQPELGQYAMPATHRRLADGLQDEGE